MSEPKESTAWNTILNRAVLPLFTFLTGVIIPTYFFAEPIKEKQIIHETRIAQVERDMGREAEIRQSQDSELRKHIESDRQQTEERMKNVVVLMESIMKQNTEVIGLFKLQQQLGAK